MLLWLNRTPESFLAVNHSSNGSMPALKESGILRMDTPRIYEAIQERRAARSMTWKDVENEMGIPASILQHFAKGGRAEFRTVVEVAIWLGRPVMEFTKTSPR